MYSDSYRNELRETQEIVVLLGTEQTVYMIFSWEEKVGLKLLPYSLAGLEKIAGPHTGQESSLALSDTLSPIFASSNPAGDFSGKTLK